MLVGLAVGATPRYVGSQTRPGRAAGISQLFQRAKTRLFGVWYGGAVLFLVPFQAYGVLDVLAWEMK